jgi:hypothetical protein
MPALPDACASGPFRCLTLCLPPPAALGSARRSIKLPESISTLDGGYITGLIAQELILHTFSGKVITRRCHGRCRCRCPPNPP